MPVETFQASVQYNDLIGSVAADNGDQLSIEHWLDQRDLLNQGEWVIGLTLSIGENHGEELVNPVDVEILLSESANLEALREIIDDNHLPLRVRRVETVMTLPEFFSLFKRFHVNLSWKREYSGVQGILDGIQYEYED